MLAIRAYLLVDLRVNAEATPDSIPPAHGTRPGLGIFKAASWARWLAIFGAGIGAIWQMAYMANYPQAYPLFNIMILTLQIVVIYALIVKWEGYKEEVERAQGSM